ncbi:MAG: class I mannose-6-phosphate isomerase [Devosia sp.]
MTLELAAERVVRKPWGRTDLRPWSELGHDGSPIGELWFERADRGAPESALLLKLLFTDEALSIQVHPADDFAHAIGLPHGKVEAWYVLAAAPGAELSLGLKRSLTPAQLRAAIVDGAIADLMHRQIATAGDAVVVPAGTIHAIGAGLVIAEIQQRDGATFRLFDYGSRRELHLDSAVGAATAGPAAPQAEPTRLSEARLVVGTSPYFVFEQIDLAANSYWEVDADCETWLLLIEGSAKLDLLSVAQGEAVFIDQQRVRLKVSGSPLKGLLAYAASAPIAKLLQSRNGETHESTPGRISGHTKIVELPVPALASVYGTRS